MRPKGNAGKRVALRPKGWVHKLPRVHLAVERVHRRGHIGIPKVLQQLHTLAGCVGGSSPGLLVLGNGQRADGVDVQVHVRRGATFFYCLEVEGSKGLDRCVPPFAVVRLVVSALHQHHKGVVLEPELGPSTRSSAVHRAVGCSTSQHMRHELHHGFGHQRVARLKLCADRVGHSGCQRGNP